MRRRGILAVGFVILAAAFPAAASTPVDVVATDASEVLPAASTTYLAWTVEIISENNFSSTVFGKELGTDTVFRVNPKGVDAASGGIEGSTLVYEQVGDIALFDPATETPLDVPDGVNTNAQEYGPSISGSRLLFGRSRRAGTSIVLFDTTTGTSQVLQSLPSSERTFTSSYPGQLNGNYAVWETATFGRRGLLRCNVWFCDNASGITMKIPNTEGVCQHGSSVDTAGTVYFGRSGLECGYGVELVELPLGGTPTVLYTLREGRDFRSSEAVDNGDGTSDLYFDQASCRTGSADIRKLASV
jgi:hypothetical protein